MSRHRLPSIPHPTQKDAALNKFLQAVRERLNNVAAEITSMQQSMAATVQAAPAPSRPIREERPERPNLPADAVSDLANAIALFYPPDAPSQADDGVPVGSLFPYAGEEPPNKYLICDGQAVSRAIFSDLFERLGIRFGEGDSSTTFNIPDLRRRYVAGPGDDFPLDEVVGASFVDLNHDHELEGFVIEPAGEHAHGNPPTAISGQTTEVQAGTGAIVSASNHSHNNGNTALAGQHTHAADGEIGEAIYPEHEDAALIENRPETLVMNYIIKARP